MGLTVHFEVLNQLGTPMMYSETLANRPAAGIVGRIFISTDTLELYRDNGTTWDQLDAANIGGSLATGQVAFGSATNTIAGSNNLFWDNANVRLGIGTNTPAYDIDVNKNGFNTININSLSSGVVTYRLSSNVNSGVFALGNAFNLGNNVAIGSTTSIPFNIVTNSTNNLRVFTTGNVLIQTGGTFTDSGQRLQVQGTSFFSDIVGIGASPSTGNSLNVASNIVGTFGTGISQQGQVQSNVTGSSFGFLNTLNIVNTAFTTNSVAFAASQGTIGGSVTLSANTGFLAASSLTTGTNVYGFRGQIASGAGRFNLFMDGTATNLLAGNLFIGGIDNPFSNLTLNKAISGNTSYSGVLQYGTVQSGVSNAFGYVNDLYAANSLTFTNYTHFAARQQLIGSGTSITNQYGFFAESNMTGATFNFGFYGNIGAGSNRWNLYMAGTALNYFAGSVGIKTTAPYAPSTFSLDVNGGLLVKNTAGTTAQLTLINADPSIGGNNGFLVASVGGTSGSSYAELQGYYGLSITGSTALRLNPSGGAVIVNSTTNSGEQFQVTGTLRVNGQRSGSAGGSSGQHLIINCDGVSYKIALLNP